MDERRIQKFLLINMGFDVKLIWVAWRCGMIFQVDGIELELELAYQLCRSAEAVDGCCMTAM